MLIGRFLCVAYVYVEYVYVCVACVLHISLSRVERRKWLLQKTQHTLVQTEKESLRLIKRVCVCETSYVHCMKFHYIPFYTIHHKAYTRSTFNILFYTFDLFLFYFFLFHFVFLFVATLVFVLYNMRKKNVLAYYRMPPMNTTFVHNYIQNQLLV